ncbi:MAG: DUF1146 domain-containing protein [Acholeplasmataceae bacterium]|jgi:uncharacterized membrane protein YwzB|nr:DUF1146 domain-containing protein [Acholeplasmataceae bacterium]
MIEKFIIMWFFFILIGLTPLTYRALMAVDFSQFFRRSSTWQIKLLMSFISICIAFIIAFAFTVVMEKILYIINN